MRVEGKGACTCGIDTHWLKYTKVGLLKRLHLISSLLPSVFVCLSWCQNLIQCLAHVGFGEKQHGRMDSIMRLNSG